MAWNFQSPFAQALVSEGQKRGYNPYAIAASLGNAASENALNTTGRPGDNGTAFGGFQWRNERKAALDAKAAKMGMTWDSPLVQAQHWYDEQDGPESRWGLKGANNLSSAQNATISALRPAGWTAGNPMGGHNYQGRLAASQEALAFLQGKGGASMGQQPPTGSPGDSTGSPGDSTGNPADMPSEGAQPISFNVPDQPKEGWEGFLEGGPGALFGAPQQGWNMGDALAGAGIAMMARDNPQGAGAISSFISRQNKAKDSPFYDIKYDPSTGRTIKIYKDGRVEAEQTTQPKNTTSLENVDSKTGMGIIKNADGTFTTQKMFDPADAPEKPVPVGALKMIQENREKADSSYEVLGKNQDYMRMLKDGKIDLSAVSRLGDNWKTALNDSDEKTRNAALFRGHIEELRNAALRLNKGVQTEGDAVRTLNEFLPGLSGYDNKTAASQLQRINKGFEGAWKRYSEYNNPLYGQYKSYDPDGLNKQQFDQRYSEYSNSRDALDRDIAGWQTAPVVPPPAPTDPKKGSFKDFSLKRARPTISNTEVLQTGP